MKIIGVDRYGWPWYSWPLAMVAGVLIGYGGVGVFTGSPRWWPLPFAIGLIMEAVWWFGIASDGACRRRHERARVAAIRDRNEASS